MLHLKGDGTRCTYSAFTCRSEVQPAVAAVRSTLSPTGGPKRCSLVPCVFDIAFVVPKMWRERRDLFSNFLVNKLYLTCSYSGRQLPGYCASSMKYRRSNVILNQELKVPTFLQKLSLFILPNVFYELVFDFISFSFPNVFLMLELKAWCNTVIRKDEANLRLCCLPLIL